MLCEEMMKLVIQNGCRHTLTRKEFEPMIELFPPKWSKRVKTIAFYKGDEPAIRLQYFEKEKVLGIFWPKESQGKQEKLQAIQDILVSLECISENHLLCLDRSNLDHLLDRTALIREKCLGMLRNKST